MLSVVQFDGAKPVYPEKYFISTHNNLQIIQLWNKFLKYIFTGVEVKQHQQTFPYCRSIV